MKKAEHILLDTTNISKGDVMKKWLLMTVLCLSIAGCEWFNTEESAQEAEAEAENKTDDDQKVDDDKEE